MQSASLTVRMQESMAYFFDASPLGVLFHSSLRPVYVNPVWSRIHGYRRDEVLAMDSVAPLVAPDDLEKFQTYQHRGTMRDGLPARCRYRAVHSDGGTVLLEVFVQRMMWAAGELVQNTVHDVIGQFNVEAAQIEQAEEDARHLATAIESASEGYALWDSDERLTLANEQYLAMFPDLRGLLRPGISFEAVIRRRVEAGQIKEAIGCEEDWIAARIAHFRNPGSARDFALDDGRWVQVRDQRLPDGGVLIMTADISERKRSEQELDRYKKHLEQLVEVRTREVNDQKEKLEAALVAERELSGLQRQFVTMVSHEFRTPLAVIDGTAHRILRRFERLGRERIERDLENVRRSVDRLIDLMESVLAAANLEEGCVPFEPGPCEIGQLLAELSESSAYLNPGYAMVLDLEDLPETIVADSKLLRQVFANLIANAVKYSSRGIEITIVGRTAGDQGVTVEVRDNGPGIAAEELPKVFQRFYRAQTSTGTAGSGIGLHLAQSFVEMHGGEIAVRSSPGEGTTFAVHLPFDCSVNDRVPPPGDRRDGGGTQDACAAIGRAPGMGLEAAESVPIARRA